MRSVVVLCFLLLTGCVSQSHNSGSADNFDQQAAAKTRISLGLTYLKNGNYSQAKFNLDKALQFAPNMANAHYSMAYYYQLVGEHEQATRSYQTAMRLEPDNADISNSYGAFLCQRGEYEQAKFYFLQAINNQAYASTAATYENLALCSQSQGQMGDAINYLQSAINHDPSRARSLYLLAQWQAGSGQWMAAKESLRRYEKMAPVSADLLWLAAEIEYGLGNLEVSRGYGEMLLSQYPDHANAKRYQNRHRNSDVSQLPAVNSLAEELEKMANTIADEQSSENQTASVLDPDAQQVYHVVSAGENLYRISLMYNIRMQKLVEWNQLSDASAIYVGKKLWIVDPQSIE